MQPSDLFRDLSRALEAESRVLRELLNDMRERRMSFVSARPSTLEQSTSQLERIQCEASRCEAERLRITAAVCKACDLAPDAPLRMLIAFAPRHVAPALRRHAAEIAKVAREIQVESRVGARLLEFSRACHEGLVQDLCGVVKEQAGSGYDRNARQTGAATQSGNLISGTV